MDFCSRFSPLDDYNPLLMSSMYTWVLFEVSILDELPSKAKDPHPTSYFTHTWDKVDECKGISMRRWAYTLHLCGPCCSEVSNSVAWCHRMTSYHVLPLGGTVGALVV